MSQSLAPLVLPSALKLGVRGLPSLCDTLSPGGLYALVAETPPARFPLLATALGAALDAQTRCAVVVAAQPELFVERASAVNPQQIAAALDDERLAVFELQDEFQNKIFRHGADAFVAEMEELEIGENSFLVLDQAESLLSLHDPAQALEQTDILRRWCETRRVTAILVFARTSANHAQTVMALSDFMAGFARLEADKNGLELQFDYWQSPEGTIAARSFSLVRLASGHYEASQNRQQAAATQSPATQTDVTPPPDGSEAHFYYMDPDLGSLARQLSGVWTHVETLVGMMHVTRGKAYATIVLNFERSTTIRQLAEAVHTLRLALGRHAKIVVREKEASLRYQNEALLLRLGVNLVVHREVHPNRIPLLLESLNGQVFARDVNIDFDAALFSVLPSHAKGYQTALRFAREVEQILARASTLSIPCALIVGKPAAGFTLEQLVASSRISRNGDLVSSDGEHFFLFLNGCPQTALLATAERVFGVAVEERLDQPRFAVSEVDIANEVAVLVRAAERGQAPDFSDHAPAGTKEAAESATPANPVTVPDRAHASAEAPVTVPHVRPAASNLIAEAEKALSSAAETTAEVVRFSYQQGAASGFGRREVPRAVRRARTTASEEPESVAQDPLSAAGQKL